MVQFNKFFVILAILVIAIVANLAFVDYQILKKGRVQREPKLESSNQATRTRESTSSASCLSDCQSIIDAKLAQAKSDLLKTFQSPSPATQAKSTTQIIRQPADQAKEIFIGLGGGGSTTSTDWTDVSGSNIDLDFARYPGAKGFYFQGNLKSDAPDRATFARLYDVNNKVGVQGSDINYAGLSSKLIESGQLIFHFSGKVTLIIQIHSLNGNLATVESPRIRVAY